MTSPAKANLLVRIVERMKRSRFLVPYVVGCALFMQMLDATVIAMALPEMSRSLNVDPVRLNIAITSYLLSVSVFIPISGWVADRFGGRNVFVAAIALFTISSMFCGLADTLPELVMARLAQGAAGAMMVPVGRIVMLRSVSKADLMQATTYLTLPALLGPVFGPPIGGFITTFSSWRWIFLMNVPMGIIGIILAIVFIKNTREEKVPPLDFRGFLLTGVALACLVMGFETMGQGEIPWKISLSILSVGGIATVLYIFHVRRTLDPIVDLSLMKIRTFSTSVLAGNLCRFNVGAAPFLMAILLQIIFGMSPFAAGMITFAGALGAIVAKVLISRLFQQYGFRYVLAANAIALGLSIAVCALFTPITSHLVIILVLFIGGVFRSLQMTGINALAFSDIPFERMSGANTLSSMMQQLAFSLGVGIAALTMRANMTINNTTELGLEDVQVGFLVLAVLAAFSAVWFLRLPENAGEVVSRGRMEPHNKPLTDHHA
ncbi:DHA2 family efflux MFS transporter permease subunit [Pseudochelatococcus sp. G4_1912]|uniref:DHA2 family efflux MFS transporter permease subunit n=1 Tax=Pseudochelatococcus sp. G4_1912 TaxID=3114288 RepID=UPI0039C71B73